MVHLLGFILVFHAFDDLLHAVADARMRYGVGAPVTGTPLRFRIDFVVAVLSESATLAFFIPVTVLCQLFLGSIKIGLSRESLDLTGFSGLVLLSHTHPR